MLFRYIIIWITGIKNWLDNKLIGHSPFGKADNCSADQPNALHWTENEGSLPCSQDPDTGPYPRKDKSSYTLSFIPIKSISILFSHLRFGLPSDLFLQVHLLKLLFTVCSPMRETNPTYGVLANSIMIIIFVEEPELWNPLTTQLSPTSSHVHILSSSSASVPPANFRSFKTTCVIITFNILLKY
jgi:hypothetical protein